MITRATVHFQRSGKTKAIIFQHCDGYPDELGHDLQSFIHTLPRDVKYDDPEMLSARFVAWQSSRSDVAVVLKDPECIEYRYLVLCNGPEVPTIKVETL